MNAFYHRRDDGTFEATDATTSPWDDAYQHAGPPLALVARVIDERHPSQAHRMGRMSIEIFGPIPKVDLTLDTRVLRPGKRIELIEARLRSAGKEVLVANVWRFAVLSATLPTVRAAPPPAKPPEACEPLQLGVRQNGYFRAFEWRAMYGSQTELGPAAVWCRTALPLFAGEVQHSRDALLALSDSANGISMELPLREWLSIPSSVTISLARDPAGEWMSLDASTQIGPDGRGVTLGILGDARGAVGNIVQALLIAPRTG